MDRADQELALGWAFTEGHLLYRFHAHVEMRLDGLTAPDVDRAGRECEVIEEDPTRREGRTKVLLGYVGPDEPLHIVVNVRHFEDDFTKRVEVVTVYRPEPPRWIDERTRGMSDD